MDLMPEADYFVPLYDESTSMSSQNIFFPFRADDAFNGALGEFADPLFGTIKADFLMQMLPDSTSSIKRTYNDASGKTTTVEELDLDGLYLQFPLIKDAWLGDSTAVQILKIYELTDGLNEEKYYADMPVEGLYNPTALAVQEVKASAGYSVKKTKKIVVDGVEKDSVWYEWDSKATWKVKMPEELTNRFWDLAQTPPFGSSTPNEVVRNVFLDYFKGIYVTSDMVDPSKQSLIPFSFVSTTPVKLVLNFKRTKIVTTVATGDTSHVVTNETWNYRTAFERKRITRALSINSGNIPNDNGAPQNLFIQGMSGRGAKIALDIEQLNSWKDSLVQGNRKLGFSNIDLGLEIDKELSDLKDHAPMANLQIWLNRKNGLPTDKPFFICGKYAGYVFQNEQSAESPVASLNADSTYYRFKLDPHYLEAYLTYINNPNDEAFLPSGKFAGFTNTNTKDGSFLYIYELDELLLMPASADMANTSLSVANNMKRVVLKSPENTDSPTKLKIKYFAY